VYGGGIGKQGAVCFDQDGSAIFQYNEFAELSELPFISDCYAMNVSGADEVWFNYYMDFPLIHLRKFGLAHSRMNFGVTGNGFAIEGNQITYRGKHGLYSRSLDVPSPEEICCVIDGNGNKLEPLPEPHLGLAFRGAHMVLNTGLAVYVAQGTAS
jgi:hypothetical protein